jgi:RNA polymerase sigma-70 factor (ECF subfamily)
MGTERERVTERQLIAAARGGDIVAFNQLLVPHEQTAYCVAWWLTGNQAAAIKATERAVLKAYRTLDSYAAGSFRAWLLSHIVTSYRNECCPGTGVHAAIPAALPPSPQTSSPPEAAQSATPSALRSLLASVLRSLPNDERMVLILGDIARLDYAEIAEATGQDVWHICSCLAHARADLAALLKHQSLVRTVTR